MQDITDFLNERKEQYIKRAGELQRTENAIRMLISDAEKAYGETTDCIKEIISDESGGRQLQSVIQKQNELLAKVELIEELQEKYF